MSTHPLAPPQPCGCQAYRHREAWARLCEAHRATWRELHDRAAYDRARQKQADLVGEFID